MSKINESFELFKEESIVNPQICRRSIKYQSFEYRSIIPQIFIVVKMNPMLNPGLFRKNYFVSRPDASVYSQRGIVLLGLKSLDEAISSFQKSIELDPLNIDYYKLRSESFIMNNDIDSAIDSITETLNIFPEDVDSQKRLKSILKTD